MPAKTLSFNGEARSEMGAGLNILANAVKALLITEIKKSPEEDALHATAAALEKGIGAGGEPAGTGRYGYNAATGEYGDARYAHIFIKLSGCRPYARNCAASKSLRAISL